MCGAIPPLLQYVFMAWCLVKHRDNFTFTFYHIFRVTKLRKMRLMGHVAYTVMEKTTGRPRSRREYYIKMDHRERLYEGWGELSYSESTSGRLL
jgi:hypothetical protein